MVETDDMPSPPPGGFPGEPGPAGPEEHQQQALERIADALEGLRSELAEIKRLLGRRQP
jgi:hypothetical protein